MSLLATVAMLAELCGAPTGPASARDPDDSPAYTAVSDEALAAGGLRTAAAIAETAAARVGCGPLSSADVG